MQVINLQCISRAHALHIHSKLRPAKGGPKIVVAAGKTSSEMIGTTWRRDVRLNFFPMLKSPLSRYRQELVNTKVENSF